MLPYEAAVIAINEYYNGDHDPESVAQKADVGNKPSVGDVMALWEIAGVEDSPLPFMRMCDIIKNAGRAANTPADRLKVALLMDAITSSVSINPPLDGRMLSERSMTARKRIDKDRKYDRKWLLEENGVAEKLWEGLGMPESWWTVKQYLKAVWHFTGSDNKISAAYRAALISKW